MTSDAGAEDMAIRGDTNEIMKLVRSIRHCAYDSGANGRNRFFEEAADRMETAVIMHLVRMQGELHKLRRAVDGRKIRWEKKNEG
jgi:hypothetical protein